MLPATRDGKSEEPETGCWILMAVIIWFPNSKWKCSGHCPVDFLVEKRRLHFWVSGMAAKLGSIFGLTALVPLAYIQVVNLYPGNL